MEFHEVSKKQNFVTWHGFLNGLIKTSVIQSFCNILVRAIFRLYYHYYHGYTTPTC